MGDRWRRHLPDLLFLSGLWGILEAGLGGWLYSFEVRTLPAVVLSVLGLAILALARVRVPLPGSSTAVGALAMLYKGLASAFVCHMLAILFLAVAFDLCWSLARGRRLALVGALSAWLGSALFAVALTWVVRYHWWAAEGWPKVLHHVGVAGSLTAVLAAGAVPLAAALAAGRTLAMASLPRWAPAGAGLLWLLVALKATLV